MVHSISLTLPNVVRTGIASHVWKGKLVTQLTGQSRIPLPSQPKREYCAPLFFMGIALTPVSPKAGLYMMVMGMIL